MVDVGLKKEIMWDLYSVDRCHSLVRKGNWI